MFNGFKKYGFKPSKSIKSFVKYKYSKLILVLKFEKISDKKSSLLKFTFVNSSVSSCENWFILIFCFCNIANFLSFEKSNFISLKICADSKRTKIIGFVFAGYYVLSLY